MSDGRLSSRLVTFGGASVHLECTPGRSADILDFLFSGVPENFAVEPHLNIRLSEDRSTSRFTVYIAGEATFAHESPGVVATWLVHAICRELAGESRSGLVLHAAAATLGDACVLLPGPTGTGKTTVVAFLNAHGYGYLSDELVFIPLGSTMVEALARPLKIKRDALTALDRYLDRREQQLFESPTEVLEAPLGSTRRPERPTLSVAVFPCHRPDACFSLIPMSPAKAGLRFMECLLNARNLAHHGFDEVVRLARVVPSFALTYGSLAQLEPNLDALRPEALTARLSRSAGPGGVESG